MKLWLMWQINNLISYMNAVGSLITDNLHSFEIVNLLSDWLFIHFYSRHAPTCHRDEVGRRQSRQNLTRNSYISRLQFSRDFYISHMPLEANIYNRLFTIISWKTILVFGDFIRNFKSYKCLDVEKVFSDEKMKISWDLKPQFSLAQQDNLCFFTPRLPSHNPPRFLLYRINRFESVAKCRKKKTCAVKSSFITENA